MGMEAASGNATPDGPWDCRADATPSDARSEGPDRV
jgi:hypothetical protein